MIANVSTIVYIISTCEQHISNKILQQGRPLVSLALDSQIFSPCQTYVAISRCPTWDKVSISSIHRDAFITDPDVINEYRRLEGVASQKLPIV